MEAQQVLLVVGAAALVIAVCLVGVAAWLYRSLDIKGVRADLSGTARAREVDALMSASSEGEQRRKARAFSDATWDGVAQRRAERPASPPSWSEGRPSSANRPTPASAADEETTGPVPRQAPRQTGSPPRERPAPGPWQGSFEFRVTRREMGTGSSQRIEE